MRYAIVSDLHANLPAWTAVLLDLRSLDADRIICLGDLVGYGPQPAEVLRSVYAEVNHVVLGNHDAVVCGKLDGSLFNETARQIILWTRDRLNAQALRFLRSLPLSLRGGGFRCAHGDLADPAAFRYVIDPADAAPSWSAVEDRLLQKTLHEGDLKSFRGAIKLYLKFLWLQAEVVSGGGDVSGNADYPPTAAQLEVYRKLAAELQQALADLRTVYEQDVPAFDAMLRARGVLRPATVAPGARAGAGAER